jgi:hypothetical protein
VKERIIPEVDAKIFWISVGCSTLLLSVSFMGLIVHKFTLAILFVPTLMIMGYYLGLARPYIAYYALLISMVTEHITFFVLKSGNPNFRFDELVTIAIVIGLCVRFWQTGVLVKKLLVIPGLVPLGLFIGENILTTVINYHNFSKGVALNIIIITGAACYISIALLASEFTNWRQFITPICVVAILESTYGILAYVISYAQGNTVYGVQVEPASGYFEAYGTMYEGNLFGHFTGAIVVLCITLLLGYLINEQLGKAQSRLTITTLIVACAGLYVSYSRASWFGALFSIVIVILILTFGLRNNMMIHVEVALNRLPWLINATPERKRQIYAIMTAFIFVGFLAFIVSPPGHNVFERITNLFNLSGNGTTGIRTQDLSAAVSETRDSPILGLGNGSFDQRFAGQGDPWILSMSVSILHDSGIVGIALIILFLWQTIEAAMITARHHRNLMMQFVIVGVVGAVACILIGAQATNSFYVLELWAFIGLAGACPSLARLVPNFAQSSTITYRTPQAMRLKRTKAHNVT